MRENEKQSRFNSNSKHEISNKKSESPYPFYRMDDDVSFRVDRTKALGNAVVPAQVKEAFEILMGLK